MKSPILFLVFNRPEPTTKVLAEIRKARPSRLYVAADGPREHKPGEAERCAEVRRLVLNAIDWPCEVKTLFRDGNVGCRRAVSGAISWFFENEEEGIILEDDCLPAPDFFRFCDFSLAQWRDDPRVMHIGGHVLLPKAGSEPLLFSRLVPIWGWATWRRAWARYDSEMELLPKLSRLPLQAWYGSQYKNVVRTIERVHLQNVDAWGARWVLTVVANEALSVLPAANLISNIGFGADATHTTTDSHMANLALGTLPEVLSPPVTDDATRVYDEAYLAEINRLGPRLQRAAQRVLAKIGL